MQVGDVRPPEDVERLTPRVDTASTHQQAADSQHRYKDGRTVDVEAFSHTLMFEGSPARMVVVLNVTARKAAEAQIVHSQKMEAIGS